MEATYDSSSKPWDKVGGPRAGTIAALGFGEGFGEGAGPEPGFKLFIGTKVGLYRSVDFDGATVHGWERLAAAPIGVMSMAVSPDFARDHTLIVGTDTGIYLSKDAGETWQVAQIPFSRSMVLTLCFSPNDLDDGVLVAGTLEDGIWYSHTRGESWYARSFGLLDATVFSLAFSPHFAQDETIYAGTDSAIYYSYNNARAWKQLDFPESAAPVLSLAVSLDFESDHTLYAGTESQGLYRSANRGESWEKMPLPAGSVNALLVSRQNGLLAATEAGIFQSGDRGETWRCLVGLPDTISLALKAESPLQRDEVVVAGLVDQGAWMATNLDDWHALSIPPIRSILGLVLSPAFERDRLAYMYGLQEGIWRTEDGGMTWQDLNAALPSLDIHALVLSPGFCADHTVVAGSPEGVFISTDAGAHWQISAQDPAGVVCFSPNGRLLAASFVEQGVRVSGDLGQSWTNVPGPWDAGGKAVALAVTNRQHFYVALLEGVDETLNIWRGTPDHYEKVLSQPTRGNAVVSFWIPTDSAKSADSAESDADSSWYVSLGNRVWKFGASIAESTIGADMEDILSLTGCKHETGHILFACTGRHLYTSQDAMAWHMQHDFGTETAIAFALSPAYPSDRTAYALLLGGTLCQGVVGSL